MTDRHMADSSVRLLQVLARSLAECEPEPASLLPCVAEAPNGARFQLVLPARA